MFNGMGGPGSGYVDGLKMHPRLPDMLELNRASGFGLGAYGYPLVYGVVPWGQQAQMLNNQWPNEFIGQIYDGGGGSTGRMPRWFTYGSGSP